MLPVFLSKLKSFLKLVFWEYTSTFKVVKLVITIQPSAYISIMLQRMFYHLVKLVARMTVQCCSVAHRNTLGRRCHCSYVECKSIWMRFCILPHLVSYNAHIGLFSRIILRSTSSQHHRATQ